MTGAEGCLRTRPRRAAQGLAQCTHERLHARHVAVIGSLPAVAHRHERLGHAAQRVAGPRESLAHLGGIFVRRLARTAGWPRRAANCSAAT
jgi:hypothetical protein